ncbi:MAG TPA: 5-formyltetrahydrofolate cyclo-ligase [Myxococcales bacterium]|nr:5-formyltetrahydrofolate cyclo-ligase [Myxococcales bacterium]
MTLQEQKSALREEVRRRPRGAPDASRAAQERLLASGLLTGTVGLYRALPSECGTELLARALGARACFPCVVPGQAELEFRREGGAWARGPLGMQEPQGERVPLREIDVLVVPAVAVDLQGRRLGRGRGHYDATLAAFRGRTAALVFESQLVPEVPVGEHDRPVDAVCTEARLVLARSAP